MVVAQKLKETEITEQNSLLLTRNLLRIAIFNISYIRGLFPEKYFNDKSVPALEMKIKKLMPMDAESRRLIDWMEKGVYDALQKKYLKTLLFCICETIEGPMIEEYAFSFSYSTSDNEEVSLNVNRIGNKKQGATFKANTLDITPNQMRSSACKMVRTLVQLMRTLDRMPEEPMDYEPPFFRSCSEQEAHHPWTKSPLKMEVGNVNSKHFALALKVKSVLDPCEDENEEPAEEDGVSLGADSLQGDDSSTSDGDDHHSQGEQYIVAPIGNRRSRDDDDMIDEDDTQDPEQDEEKLTRVKDWIASRHTSTIELTDVLSSFPDISVVLTEEIIEKLMKEGLLSLVGRDSYTINRRKKHDCEDGAVKEEIDMEDNTKEERTLEIVNEDKMYMKALYHALPLDYVTVCKLHSKMKGEANQTTIRKLIDKMVEDGYVMGGRGNRRLGKRVIHSETATKKFLEVKKALDNTALDMEINGYGTPNKFSSFDFPLKEGNHKDASTYGAIQSIGSDLTRTGGRLNKPQSGSVRSEQTMCAKTGESGNTPMSRAEPAASGASGIPGNEGADARDLDATTCSRSTQDKRSRKASTVKEPILQSVKRQKSEAA